MFFLKIKYVCIKINSATHTPMVYVIWNFNFNDSFLIEINNVVF